ncbi:amidohydrolase family protein [Devosia sp. SL43]|uniref:amidohydrolase family protein n=1 Tax=Devosia sp. SL43 TaxID=2806348 RepID=UPI001F19C2BF|nr:amidohydrolase family protein [Devosia sp. SL43]UJW85367.1 amidohydrolase family protein [Devosia sp. SL43]
MIADAEAPLCLPPLPLTRQPAVPLPAGTVDTHFHVFKHGAPLNTPRSYTPQVLTLTDWRQIASATGIARGVLVQPSVYGFDNSVLLEALATDPANLRGVVVLPQEISLGELRQLDRLGVRGVRINTRNKGGLPFDAVADFAAPLADLGWTLQFQVRPEQLPAITDLAPTLGAPVVLDHLGFIPLGAPDTETRVTNLQRLLDTGRAYVKLSAPYRLGDPTAFAQIATRLVQSHPTRLLWATDWPHTELWADMPDDADLIDAAFGWFNSDAVRQTVFVDNPQSLFF